MQKVGRSIRFAVATGLFLLFWTSGSALFAKNLLNQLSREEQRKLDALAKLVLLNPQAEERLAGFRKMQGGQRLFSCLVLASGDIRSEVERLGGFVGSVHGEVWTVYLPVERVPYLVKIPQVRFVEGAKKLPLELDTSLPRNGAGFLHLIPPYGLRGRGVIIGITDSGIDLSHPDFYDSLGQCRILYLWDQYDSAGPAPPEFNYGTEYSPEDLAAGPSRQKDKNGHGTFVAGVAAGNGRAGGYVGMAPEANLIIVKTAGGMYSNILGEELNTAGLLDAYAYIRMRAQALGRPFVINTSRGTTIGPHDGTTLLSRAVNEEVARGSIIVVSAGNYSNKGWHAEGKVHPSGGLSLRMKVYGSETSIYVDFWYETNDRLRLEVFAPSGQKLLEISGDTSGTIYDDEGRIEFTGVVQSPLNNDNEFLLRILKPLYGNEIKQGTWRFYFTPLPENTLPDGGEVDGWIIRDVKARFTSWVDRTETIGELASTDSVISVASFNNKRTPAGDLSSFSSYGPRRDGRLKPDLAAAGGGIVSTRSFSSDYNPYQGNNYYSYASGTSFSAPHVAGAVALLLEQEPGLRAGQVKRLLQRSARADFYTGIVPNEKWGYGKLDALKLLEPYLSPVPLAVDLPYQNPPAVPIFLRLLPQGTWRNELIREWTLTTTGNIDLGNVLPGRYSYEVHPAYPYALRKGTLTVALDADQAVLPGTVERAAVFLVDDERKDYERYLETALDSIALPYGIIEDTTAVLPEFHQTESDTLPILVWITGDEADTVLTWEEKAKLMRFLDAGGKLLLSGQNLVEDSDTSAFASRFLKVRFGGNTAEHVLKGAAGNPVMGDAPFLFTNAETGAQNQTASDILLPQTGAVPFLYYSGADSSAAGVLVEGAGGASWRVILLGFGLEAVGEPPDLSGYLSLPQFLKGCLNWLNGSPTVEVAETQRKGGFSLPEGFAVYPNPVREGQLLRLVIPADILDADIILYDLLGRRIWHRRVALTGGMPQSRLKVFSVQQEFRNLASGTYILSVRSQGRIVFRQKLLFFR